MLIVACRAYPAPSTIGNINILGLTVGQCQACASKQDIGQRCFNVPERDRYVSQICPTESLTASRDSDAYGTKVTELNALPLLSSFLKVSISLSLTSHIGLKGSKY